MIPGPTIIDVFRMFGKNKGPLSSDDLKDNYGDRLLATTYLPHLLDEGWINKTEEGYSLSNKAIEDAIKDAQQKQKEQSEAWTKRIKELEEMKA